MIHHLRAAGSSLLLDARGTRVPVIVHWGADLGPLDDDDLTALADTAIPAVPPSAVDHPLELSLLPAAAQGWTGRPALTGFWSDGRALPGDLTLLDVVSQGPRGCVLELDGADGGVRVTTEIELTAHGVLRVRHTVQNLRPATLDLATLDVVLPVPDRARELLDFGGKWSHERAPQRTPLGVGTWLRETRHGRPGHDDPFLLVAGTPGFGFRSGEVWALHVAWSGDKRVWAEHQALGRSVVGGGELLAPGEVRLAEADRYSSPWLVCAWSGNGLDGLSDRFHPWIREHTPVRLPRPVVLNTWEAVYFDQDAVVLDQLVDLAASVGVERFVLDDGWFTGRSDDRRALGDWTVDPLTWPDGLHPLADRVQSRGMDLGLWVEPEMISLDSDLAREHPDWVLGPPSAATWRHQRVLDLSVPAAFDHVLGRLSALLREYPIAFLKWDQNRDQLEGSVHRQTTATYRLLDAVRRTFPDLEIESCSSGGGRVDLGILERVDRVWPSDTNDPFERQQIQRWTGLLIPPEYLGGHLGAATAHTTGRTSDLAFRLGTAFFGSAGIEWDLTKATPAELDLISGWVEQHKAMRGLLHTGKLVHCDASDPAIEVHAVVAPDRRSALFAVAVLAAPADALPAPVQLIGLDPVQSYRVRPLTVGGEPRAIQATAPPWWVAGEVVLPGRVLEEVGLPLPLLAPQQIAFLQVDAHQGID